MPHRNARLTVHGRRLLIHRVRSGRPVAHVAEEMGISRATAHKWVRRWRAEGDPGLFDRSSRPHTTPQRTVPETEAAVCDLRQARKLGPARIGPILGLPASTVHRILTRHGLNRLAWLDRPTGLRRTGRVAPLVAVFDRRDLLTPPLRSPTAAATATGEQHHAGQCRRRGPDHESARPAGLSVVFAVAILCGIRREHLLDRPFRASVVLLLRQRPERRSSRHSGRRAHRHSARYPSLRHCAPTGIEDR